MLTSNSYPSKYVWFIRLLIPNRKFRKIFKILINNSSDSNHSLTFTVLVVDAFTDREDRKKQGQQAEHIHNLLLSIVVFICESNIFRDSCKCQFMESRYQQYKAYC